MIDGRLENEIPNVYQSGIHNTNTILTDSTGIALLPDPAKRALARPDDLVFDC